MIRPLREFIAVKPAPVKKSAVLEVVTAEDMMHGEVLAVGTGKRLKGNRVRPMCVKPGDVVRFRMRSARTWFDPKFDRDVLLIMEDDVLGVVPRPCNCGDSMCPYECPHVNVDSTGTCTRCCTYGLTPTTEAA